jgi:DNA-directed RNA polymerase I subunit RPA2
MGGIRLGEMERDSLLAHGAAFCLNDRLMKCSDYSEGYVCKKCGSILSTYVNREIIRRNNLTTGGPDNGDTAKKVYAVNERV